MLKSIAFQQLRGMSGSYQLYPTNQVYGRNRAGKSGIKEAICFAFGGTDSAGVRLPVHLISKDQERMRVDVESERSQLSRTLTRKKSSTTALVKNGVRTELTQAELAKLLCEPDLFLSVFVPGYFMGLSPGRKQQVLADSLPPVDRVQLVEQHLGWHIDEAEGTAIQSGKRPELIAGTFAQHRREFQHKREGLLGQLQVLKSVPNVEEPVVPDEVHRREGLEKAAKEWERFEAASVRYNEALNSRERIIEERKRQEERKALIEGELAAVVRPKTVCFADHSAEIADLQAQIKPLVGASLQKVVSSDHCPTCGQVVGSKYREHIIVENKRREEEATATNADITAFNASIAEAISKLQAEDVDARKLYMASLEVIGKHDSHVASMKAQLAAIRIPSAPVPLDPPVPPAASQPSVAELDNVRKACETYQTAKAQYDYALARKKEAATKVEEIESRLAPMEADIKRYAAIEEALSLLPQKELELQKAMFDLGGFRLEMGDDDPGLVNSIGIPYHAMSTAEALNAAVRLSLRLNELMPRKVGMVFIDNADLLDSSTKAEVVNACTQKGMQTFFAYVKDRFPTPHISEKELADE